jgi:DNA-binding NarL/FixJ family response regulator
MYKPHSCFPRLLFVDDEQNVLNAMNRIFHDDPYEVLTASSGQAGLELLQNSGPVQLIISDYRMPNMNGVELLQKVMQQWPNTRRVILSGYTDTEVLLAALNEGRVHRFLVKPWDNEGIKTVVSELLDEYRTLTNFQQGADQLAHSNRLLSRTNEHLSSMLSDILANMRHVVESADTAPYAALPNESPVLKKYESLSPREREIMLAVASGFSLKALSSDLGLSIKTISTYKKRLFDKMCFKNDAELIYFTLKNNLLPNKPL